MDIAELSWPRYGRKERRAVRAVVDSGLWWRNEGRAVDCFERDFGLLENSPRVIGVTNGTHALELALMASRVVAGDEVVVPALTFYSTLSAVQRQFATPMIVDVDLATWNLASTSFADAVTDRTKAVIPVHYGGIPADLATIAPIAARHDVALVQDAAHGPGLRPAAGALTTFGGIVTYSFQHSKLLPGGEGGAIATADEELYRRSLLVQNCGRAPDGGYAHVEVGSNFRMPELTGAILGAQLERWSKLAKRRRRGAEILRGFLAEIEGLTLQTQGDIADRQSNYLIQARLSAPQADASLEEHARDAVVKRLQHNGIPVSRVYPPLFKLPVYERSPRPLLSLQEIAERCPVAVSIARTGMSFHHRLLLADRADLERVAEHVAGAVASVSS